jgi:hypothetical protein
MEIWEWDYSHQDQSVKTPQIDAENLIFEALGLPRGAMELMDGISSCPARGFKRSHLQNFSLFFKPGHKRRITGSPHTSVGNSISNLITLVPWSFQRTPETFTKMGMVAVGGMHRDISDATFLRGTWMRYSDGALRYTVLPSQLTKLGKTMNPINNERVLRMTAYSFGAGMKSISDNYPILGAFKRTLLRLGIEAEPYVRQHKIMTDKMGERIPIDRDFAEDWMFRRYAITKTDIDETEKMFSRVDRLPAFVGHPAFLKLRNVDYY